MENSSFSISEKELIGRIQEGDKVAFAEVYRMYFPYLCDFANQMLSNEAVCEELVQDVFFNIWKIRSRWSPEGSIRSYLYKAVKNRVLDHIRHIDVERRYLSEYILEREDTEGAWSDDKNQSFGQEEPRINHMLVKAVNQAIEELPGRRKTIFLLSRKDGLTHNEISEVLGISVKTVENQMNRALAYLKKQLSGFLTILWVIYVLDVLL